ncbi:hypothetical protein NQ317_019861 [Molorchus minor]|uniref:Uncharacterized protein n=1 Tax=Molorchus minor TaxID=1323400 RepID=A0ABQ9IU94_9CUCU|nr:hypothetical protein NQ317_019861 [Molorchus minor]
MNFHNNHVQAEKTLQEVLNAALALEHLCYKSKLTMWEPLTIAEKKFNAETHSYVRLDFWGSILDSFASIRTRIVTLI